MTVYVLSAFDGERGEDVLAVWSSLELAQAGHPTGPGGWHRVARHAAPGGAVWQNGFPEGASEWLAIAAYELDGGGPMLDWFNRGG